MNRQRVIAIGLLLIMARAVAAKETLVYVHNPEGVIVPVKLGRSFTMRSKGSFFTASIEDVTRLKAKVF